MLKMFRKFSDILGRTKLFFICPGTLLKVPYFSTWYLCCHCQGCNKKTQWFSHFFGRFRIVFGRFRIVFGRFRIVCGRFRIVFAPFRTILNRKKPEKRNGNENERKKTEKTNKKTEKFCENHFLWKPLKPKVNSVRSPTTLQLWSDNHDEDTNDDLSLPQLRGT